MKVMMVTLLYFFQSQIMSKRHEFLQFLIQLADYGIENKIHELRERVQQLLDLIPSDTYIVNQIKAICHEHTENGSTGAKSGLENIFLTKSPMQALYNLEVSCLV